MSILRCLLKVGKRGVVASVAAVLGVAPLMSQAEHHEQPDDSFNLATLECWDLTGLEESDRAYALLMVYGYVAGQSSMSTQSASGIQAAFEIIGRLCDANPDMYVASAVKRAVGHDEE
ncbi:MAG: HdeA/HdeB family chaperone [Pseudomonadota bacterium]